MTRPKHRAPRAQAMEIVSAGVGNEPLEAQLRRRCPRASASALRDAAAWALRQAGDLARRHAQASERWRRAGEGAADR